jgi:hypothetical protein
VLAVALARLASRTIRLVDSAHRLSEMLEAELPPTIAQVRDVGARVDRLVGEAEPRIARVDNLMNEASVAIREAMVTMEEVQASMGALRGPINAVEGVRRRLGLGPRG